MLSIYSKSLLATHSFGAMLIVVACRAWSTTKTEGWRVTINLDIYARWVVFPASWTRTFADQPHRRLDKEKGGEGYRESFHCSPAEFEFVSSSGISIFGVLTRVRLALNELEEYFGWKRMALMYLEWDGPEQSWYHEESRKCVVSTCCKILVWELDVVFNDINNILELATEAVKYFWKGEFQD